MDVAVKPVAQIGRGARTREHVPLDFTDFFRHYYPMVQRLVRSYGIEQQNVEDVAMAILTKFYEKGALEDYRPDFVSEHGGVRRPAVFTTFLSGFVFAYVRHHRNRQTITARREAIIMDAAVAQPGSLREGSTWAEVYGPRVEDDHDDLYHDDLVNAVRRALQSLPPSSRARVDIVALFDRMVEQIQETGHYDTAALAQEFGVSQSAIRNWIPKLRDEVRAVLEAD